MNRTPGSWVCWLFFVFLPLTAAAQGQSTNLPPATLPFPEVGASLLRVLGALTLVVGIFLAGVWCFRHWQRLAWQKGRNPRLNILEVRPLGHRQALYLVACDQERLLLGSSPAGLHVVAHLPPAPDPLGPAPMPPFAAALERAAHPQL